MKSRVTTYILVVAVIAVWGVIAWKIVFPGAGGAAPSAVQADEPETPAAYLDVLSFDYPDPFLKELPWDDASGARQARRQEEPASGIGPPALPPPSLPPIPPPQVVYAGTISTTDGRTVYLFAGNRLLHSLVPGESFDGYRLSGAWNDSVRFERDDRVFILYRQR